MAGTHHREEEEEDDDEDEGMVEDHLQQRDDNPSHNSPKPKSSGCVLTSPSSPFTILHFRLVFKY